ncbi:NTP transferase domain-containing protein [Enterobacteriaceae bacterium 4M9]|nr:NTP transferase domain-containing protein [Enterobacteriaceae bacterium 4M9]
MPGILLLAAGQGRRYRAAGGRADKLMAAQPQHANRPLFAVVLEQAIASRLRVHVVTRPGNDGVRSLAHERGIALTIIDSGGMGESIAAGVQATAHWRGWLLQPADMPQITAADYQAVALALETHSQARPHWQGQPGHPVGFSERWCNALCQLQGDKGARALLNHALILLPGHAGVIDDRDLPALPPADFCALPHPQ